MVRANDSHISCSCRPRTMMLRKFPGFLLSLPDVITVAVHSSVFMASWVGSLSPTDGGGRCVMQESNFRNVDNLVARTTLLLRCALSQPGPLKFLFGLHCTKASPVCETVLTTQDSRTENERLSTARFTEMQKLRLSLSLLLSPFSCCWRVLGGGRH